MDGSALNRRAAVGLGAAAFGALLPLRRSSAAAAETLQGHLPKVNVSEDRILRQVAGLRPFRPSGFLVKSEALGDKTVVHNYGHGGCGVTLSWGTADMAATLASATPHRKAAVIGCGVIGLTSAWMLQERGFEVAIYAADLPPHTTSDVAAGAFGVTSLVDDDHRTPEIASRIQQAVRFAYKYFEGLIGPRYSVRWMDMYMLSASPVELPWDSRLPPNSSRSRLSVRASIPFRRPMLAASKPC